MRQTMTEEPREALEAILHEIRDMFADMHAARRKIRALKEHFQRQRRTGIISRFRYDVEINDLQRLEQTMEAQWARLQQQRSRALEKLRRLA